MSENQFELLWKPIKEILQKTISPIVYTTYIEKLEPVDVDGTKIVLKTV